jgi:DNA-directed RNA polymerase specialized sigma subunit
MTLVCLPDSSEDETLLRLQHAELQEWLTFTLHYYERLTTKEMKQVLGATESSISQLHASALSRLRESLADHAKCAPLVLTKTGKTIQ